MEGHLVLHPVAFKNTHRLVKWLGRQRLPTTEDVNWAYKSPSEQKRVCMFAEQVQSAYSRYARKVEKVVVDACNAQELIGALCFVKEQAGILVRATATHALLRTLRTDFSLELKPEVEWFPLTTTVRADLSLGFVPRQTLLHSIFEARLRNLKFVSFLEN
jgi:hypothetical protein